MRKIIVDNYEQLSNLAASTVFSEVMKDKQTNLSITGGSSPKGLFKVLIEKFNQNPDLIEMTKFFHFDETEYNNKKFTQDTLIPALYEPANVPEEQIFWFTYDNYQNYPNIIEENGGLDLMIIGLGADGHFCGNMPIATKFEERSYKVPIKEEYPWYKTMETLMDKEEIPEYFVTLGYQELLKVKHLVMIVNGENKADALKRMLADEISTEFPATILRTHPNFTLIVEKSAVS